MSDTTSKAPTTKALTKDEREEVIKAGYSHAQTQIRVENLTRFNELRQTYIHTHGVPDWKPEPTKEEKAQAKIDELLEQFPDLAPLYGRDAGEEPEDSSETD